MDEPRAGAARGGMSAFTRRVIEVFVIGAVAFALFRIVDALLLGFAGLLLAVILHALTGALTRYTGLSRKPALVLVTAALFGLIGVGAWFLGPLLADQFDDFATSIPALLEQVRTELSARSWGRYVLGHVERLSAVPTGSSGRLISRLTGAAVSVLDALLTLIIVVFVGVFIAADPALYKRSIVRLFPLDRQERIKAVLNACGYTLKRWLIGTLAAMTFIFIATTAGLMLIGVPHALFLGFLAGLCDFVPFFGPIAAAVPGLLIAAAHSPETAAYAALLYLGIQQLEGNLVTPLVHQRAIFLPPAFVTLALIAFGLLFGPLGIVLATPLSAVLLIVIKMLYVEDVLGQDAHVKGAITDAPTDAPPES